MEEELKDECEEEYGEEEEVEEGEKEVTCATWSTPSPPRGSTSTFLLKIACLSSFFF